MSDLIFPTLDLFLYDLRDALNLTEAEKQEKQAKFRAKLPADSQFSDPDLETKYLELLPKQKYYDFTTANDTLQGYYYPVRLNDTYGLQIDCSINNQTDPQTPECFARLRAEIEWRLQGETATLGQTWMLSGWLPKTSSKSYEYIAKSCYHVFQTAANWSQDLQGVSTPESSTKPEKNIAKSGAQVFDKAGNWSQDLHGKGSLFGGEVFELWRYQPLNQVNCHVIIMLFSDQESMEKAAELYTDWMGLFSYRNKILWAYSQSRLIKKTLVAYYKQVEANQRLISDENASSFRDQTIAAKLDDIQNSLGNYTLDLPKLNFQNQIIEINLFNYQTRLEIINQKCQKLGADNNLEFLETFSKEVKENYLLQVTKDYDIMEMALRLLETRLNAIRSQIELEKAERDRTFQTLVTVVGAGTAVTALMDFDAKQCDTLSTLIPPFKKSCENPLINSVIVPVGLILIFGVIALCLKKILSGIRLG
ncbi:hypothetical protein BJP36_09320 [Moorena producens JHB]|uniref:Uncharacterized protein n=1 Tax=Moorena producens (strain JHB) TaxID=1454205 RepID=A0A1D9FXK0_MOOP1|nr:hypothetical protein [Moorena producens]AOY80098.1 hypothetical protein BJP36_09320 [Moorena producens JHB]